MVHRYALAARAAGKPVWLIRTGQAPGPGMAHRCALAYHGARARYGSYVRVGARAATPRRCAHCPALAPGPGSTDKKGGAFAPPDPSHGWYAVDTYADPVVCPVSLHGTPKS